MERCQKYISEKIYKKWIWKNSKNTNLQKNTKPRVWENSEPTFKNTFGNLPEEWGQTTNIPDMTQLYANHCLSQAIHNNIPGDIIIKKKGWLTRGKLLLK